MMKAIFRQLAPRVWGTLTARGPQRGTWSHLIGSYSAAIVMGLIYWWIRYKH